MTDELTDSVNELTSWIETLTFVVAALTFFATVISIWIAIVGLREGAIKKSLKKMYNYFDNLYSRLDFLRRRLNRRINSKAFLEWQDEMLKKIYGEEYFTEILGKKYPVHCISFNQDYNVDNADSLCWNGNQLLLSGNDLKLPKIRKTDIMQSTTVVDKDGNKKAVKAEKAFKKKLMGNGFFRKGYKWFTARSMRDGNHVGFILDHLDFNGKDISKIHLSIGDYELNLLTSHIMTYELFKAYEKFQKEAKVYKTREAFMNHIKLDKLWPELPFRHYIHHVNNNNIKDVLFTGRGRFSLLSVQCLVMLCTSEEGELEYKAFLGKRSDSTRKVSTKLGCYQFPPSGGFDLYEKEKLKYNRGGVLEQNCSLTLALMREYLEELFDEDKYSRVDNSNNMKSSATIAKVNDDNRTKEIRKCLKTDVEDGRFNIGTKKAYFNTVGANVDLIDLRLSVNFLLVINDYNYYSKYKELFKFNQELGTDDEGQELKMLLDWKSVDETLVDETHVGRRNIVEDSVALYAQGKQAFREYLDKVVKNKSRIALICND